VRIKSSRLLTTGDEPMLRRLKPPYKIDQATGKKVYDYIDEDGNGRFKNRRWFSHLFFKHKYVGVSLNANEREVRQADYNLGMLLQDLQLGKTPNGTRKKIRLLKPLKPFDSDALGSRKNYIDPFFGEYTPNELTLGLMEKYLEFRWKKDKEGNLQAKERTLKGEMIVLRQLVESADENFNFHKRLLADLKYVSLFTDLLPPLTRTQIDMAWEQAKITRGGANFKRAFWIMVFTGMEAMDICTLCPKHFVNIKGKEWLVKDRHKTRLQKKKTIIKIPVLSAFKEILSEVPTPIDKNTPYFPNMDNKGCNDAIIKYFKRVKQEVDGVTTYPLKGYGSKYLRRHLGELALDMGKSETWVQQALGHAFDSKITRKYMRVREDSMMDVFGAIGGNG
jgi:integrase